MPVDFRTVSREGSSQEVKKTRAWSRGTADNFKAGGGKTGDKLEGVKKIGGKKQKPEGGKEGGRRRREGW